MTGPSDDDRADDMLVQGARDYNLPRAVPRDEIWAKIAEARRPTATRPLPSANRRRVWIGSGVGVAAALLLSTGIIIGRHTNHDAAGAPTVAQPPRTASAAPTKPAGSEAPPAPTKPRGAAQVPVVEQLQQETRRTNAAALESADASPTARGDGSTAGENRGSSLAYHLVVMRHLAGSEAMITSFRASARRGERDSTMAEWSRELLSTTRTLEASRAENDPVMKRLLDDLDLVISQIVQYTTKGTHNPDELDLIEHSIDRRGIITELRSTLPARGMSAGT